MDALFGSWDTQTLIAGPTADTLIALWVIKSAMDGPAFATYDLVVLIPEVVPDTSLRIEIRTPQSLSRRKVAGFHTYHHTGRT